MSARIMAVLYEVNSAAFRAMGKFHRETDCGLTHEHWRECQTFCRAMGYESWEHWKAYESGDVSRLEELMAQK